MKIKITSYLYLAFVIILYIVNYFFLKINWFPFTGMVLGALIIFVIGVNIYLKFKNKREGLNSEDFIFSPEVAKNLKKVDIGIQYESSMIATFFLIVGLLLFSIYTIFFTPYPLIMKIFITFNSFFAMILLGSMLITSYQQFISYRESTKMFTQFAGKVGSELISDDKMKEMGETEISEEQEKKLTEGEFVDFTKLFNERRIN